MSLFVTSVVTSPPTATVLPPGPDPAAIARERANGAARKRRARYRRKLLERLWRPVGIRSCGGAEVCPWKPEGDFCGCTPDRPCDCERRVFEALRLEGHGAFGVVVSGMIARLLLDSARAAATEDPESVALRVKLVTVLLADMRQREDLRQRERRLALEEEKARPQKGPDLREYLKSLAAERAEQARHAAASTAETSTAAACLPGAGNTAPEGAP
jgi:hypothetical protein